MIFQPLLTTPYARGFVVRAEAYRMLESGAFTPFVSTQYPLEAAPQAHIDVITPAKGGAAGNLVIVPSLSSST